MSTVHEIGLTAWEAHMDTGSTDARPMHQVAAAFLSTTRISNKKNRPNCGSYLKNSYIRLLVFQGTTVLFFLFEYFEVI